MKRKAWLILLVPVLLILLWVFILQPLHRTSRLLKRAGIPISAIRGVIDQDYWYDWLEYTDGYDWVILRVDPDGFTPPQDWNATSASLADVKPQDGSRYHNFHWDFREHSALPETFTAWVYIPADPSVPSSEQEWFAAMFDETSGVLTLYRGHALYGIIPWYPVT